MKSRLGSPHFQAAGSDPLIAKVKGQSRMVKRCGQRPSSKTSARLAEGAVATSLSHVRVFAEAGASGWMCAMLSTSGWHSCGCGSPTIIASHDILCLRPCFKLNKPHLASRGVHLRPSSQQ